MLNLTFFHKFLDVFIVQNRVIRLNKSLFRGTYSIKEFTFDPHFAYQIFKLTAELHLTGKKILFFSREFETIQQILRQYIKISFHPYSINIFAKTLQQSSSFLHFFYDFQNSNSC